MEGGYTAFMKVWKFCLSKIREAEKKGKPSNVAHLVSKPSFLKEYGLLD